MITRDLHLYLGLFLSPFVLVFAVTFSSWSIRMEPCPTTVPRFGLRLTSLVSASIERLSGREQVAALRPALEAMDVHGEVGFIRRIPKENRLVFPGQAAWP